MKHDDVSSCICAENEFCASYVLERVDYIRAHVTESKVFDSVNVLPCETRTELGL